MRARTAIIWMTLHLHVAAHAAEPVVSADWAADSAPRPAPREQAIKDAVRAALAEEAPAKPLDRADAFRTEQSDALERGFEEARVPGCLRPDGLKRQPTGWGPFQLGSLLALPFIAVAKIRGKCN